MSSADQDPVELLRKLSESYRQVRLGRGVAAKAGHVMLALMVVWGVVAWRWSADLLADAGLLVAGLAATAVVIWWVRSTQSFAERNPAQAMLEGAEFLEYQRFEAQAKGITSLAKPGSPAIAGELSAPERGDPGGGKDA